jgi:hypothetical protein
MAGNGPGDTLSQELLFAEAQAFGHGSADGIRGDFAAAVNAPQPAPLKGALVVEHTAGARLAGLDAAWQDLCARAETGNIFMNPVLARFAGDAYPERPCLALLAWQDEGLAPRRLMGVWTFAIGRAPHSPIPSPMLCAPCMPNGYLSTPVIDRHSLDAVLGAMIEYVAAHKDLPKIVALDAMGTDSATMQALVRVLQARGTAPFVFNRSLRPHLASRLDGKSYLEQAFSSSSRKKLRQHRRRLAEKGELKSVILSEPATVRRGFEDFLNLEAAGWKGREDTALLSNPADAGCARAMIGSLADNGDAAIHMLTLDARPVSMQVVLRAGSTAFTWKTAYDETLHDVSPGTLLLEDYTAALLADRTVTDVDSCAFDDGGYMAAWTERAEISNLWFDARRGGTPAFFILSYARSVYLAARIRAKTVYHEFWRLKSKPKKTN